MIKVFSITAVLMLSACSSYNTGKPQVKGTMAKEPTLTEKYISSRNTLVPVNAVASSNNVCVDNFNFLRQSGAEKYQTYSKDYVKIGSGYTFLNTNKNIMGSDAKTVYTMQLDMKLEMLCNKVDYAGFQVIKEKIKSLHNI